MKRLNKKEEDLREKYEEKLMEYMRHQDKTQLIIPSNKLERKVFQELLLSYSSFLTGNTKELLRNALGKESVIGEIKKNLKSKNPWKKRIATYQAGEFGVNEVSTKLLKQLETNDRELIYITARALIKIGGKTYLKEILREVAKGNKMEKNNILILIEMIDEDIKDTLEVMMLEQNSFINALALEIYGKRQYVEGVKWIKKMVLHSLKEVRIAALKGGYALGDIGDKDYLNRIVALEKDKEWEVRAFLTKFLKNVKTEESINILVRLMKDPNWLVRHNAAIALNKQGERGLRALIELLDSEDRFARDKAREVIHKEIIFHELLSKLEEGSLKNKLLQRIDTTLLEVTENS
ncbi:MAG: HEAT repeat domain-containing protein [Clostridiaceae bacterium]|nr:HEAT repeat domain-containing protein [Clostridiaceae bacterium]